jgi:hypothetical protein
MTEVRYNGVSGAAGSAPSAPVVTPEQAKKALDKMLVQPILNNATKVMAKNYESIKNSGKS